MQLRNACADDIPAIMSILDDGRRAQRRMCFRQWEDGYPSPETIRDDIMYGYGVLLCDECIPVAYAALVPDADGYMAVADRFSLHGRYMVIHRMAVADAYRGKGNATLFFSLLEERVALSGISIICADTGAQNKVMLHLLERLGYSCIGELRFPWGLRYAFEKRITGYFSSM